MDWAQPGSASVPRDPQLYQLGWLPELLALLADSGCWELSRDFGPKHLSSPPCDLTMWL